jgi:hypothetical protein
MHAATQSHAAQPQYHARATIEGVGVSFSQLRGAWPQSDRRGAACGACTYLLLRHLLGQLGGNPPSPANRAGAGRGRLRCGAVS